MSNARVMWDQLGRAFDRAPADSPRAAIERSMRWVVHRACAQDPSGWWKCTACPGLDDTSHFRATAAARTGTPAPTQWCHDCHGTGWVPEQPLLPWDHT